MTIADWMDQHPFLLFVIFCVFCITFLSALETCTTYLRPREDEKIRELKGGLLTIMTVTSYSEPYTDGAKAHRIARNVVKSVFGDEDE